LSELVYSWSGSSVRAFGGALALGGTLALLGCGGPSLKAPSDLGKDLKVATTKGRKGTTKTGGGFAFGPYRVEDVQRAWSNPKPFEVFEKFTPKTGAGYRYRFAGGGEKSLQGKCAVPEPEELHELDGTVTVKEQDQTLACVCLLGDQLEARLFVEDLAGEFGGPLIVRDVELRATGLYQLSNGQKHPVPAGYQIDSEDGPVAGVEVLPGKARVWIRKDLKSQDERALSCALAGLLLYEPEMPPKKKPERSH
jgi:hypothetical protein